MSAASARGLFRATGKKSKPVVTKLLDGTYVKSADAEGGEMTACDEIVVDLPWPDKGLSPNARTHWRAKARLVANARRYALYATLAAMKGGRLDRNWQPLHLDVTFRPPSRRRMDLDNRIASMKAAFDGISDALRIDDSRFVSTYRMGPPVKNGAVKIIIETSAERARKEAAE